MAFSTCSVVSPSLLAVFSADVVTLRMDLPPSKFPSVETP